ncbi:hypothetical protein GIB67_031156, partial [Kingdonia uniflora]
MKSLDSKHFNVDIFYELNYPILGCSWIFVDDLIRLIVFKYQNVSLHLKEQSPETQRYKYVKNSWPTKIFK